MTSSVRHANNYKGLKQRQSYDEIVDYLNNKQEKIIFPTRLAKSLRNSNQLSNLLDGDGEGLINMELQQQNIIKEQQKEHAITAMTDAKSTAKVTKIMATQTKLVKQSEARSQTTNPKFKVSETQTANSKVYTGSKGVQTQEEPLTYDLTAQDDKSEQLANDIVMESQHQSQQVKKRKGKIVNLLVEHFENISPGSMNIAHVMASSGSMASSSHIPPIMEGIQLNEPNKRSPEDEPKGKRGRPRKKQRGDVSPEPMLIDKELKRPQKPSPPQSKKNKKNSRGLMH